MPEPIPSERTYKWLRESIQHRVENDWLDVRWLALLADALGVNIVVCEPAGVNNQLRVYAAGGVQGIFLYEYKKARTDEGGTTGCTCCIVVVRNHLQLGPGPGREREDN